MKNLFKSLMLVAVAAMAFTACSQDVNEVNKVEKVTRYEFVADFADDTRSGFTEKEEGATAYKSEWHEGDQVKVFVDGYEPIVADITVDGKFELELTDAPEFFYMTVVSPAESWVSEYTAKIPAEQTPLANSVDPKAHLLQAQAVPVSNGFAAISMTHMAAYGKRTVNAGDFSIHHVVIDLKGSFYGYDRALSYTINADNVENNIFWFATEPIDVAEFTVTAYDAEGNAVAKTVDVAAAGKTLSFNYGRVGTFSVSGLEAVTEPETPAVPVFTSAYVDGSYSDCYLHFNSDDLGELVLNAYKIVGDDGVLPVGTYSFGAYSGVFYTQGYSYYKPVDSEKQGLDGGTVVVSVVDGQYHFEFIDLKSWTTVVLNATYTGPVSGLNIPDTRTPLATPNVTATTEGNIITISWDAVTGADEYYVFCYAGGLDSITTTETSVTIEAAYGTKYDFLIRAIVNDSNPDYKNSEDYYFSVTTEKDPNVFADVVATNIIWDSSNGAFKMTGEVVSGTAWGHSSDYIRLYMNEADRPGNNSIKVGQYTGCGGTSPQAGQFGARLCLYWGNLTYPSAVGSASTVDVTYDEVAGYTIVLTHNNKTYGYKGMPEGWVAPSEGSDEPEPEPEPEPDPDQPVVADGTSIATAYTFTTYSTYQDFGYPVMCFSGAENGATFNFESNSQTKYPTGFQYFSSGAWYTTLCEYSINGVAQSVDVNKSITWLEGDNTNGYTVEYIYIVTTDGNGIYYKYDGKFFF